jgi:hypothetical protein
MSLHQFNPGLSDSPSRSSTPQTLATPIPGRFRVVLRWHHFHGSPAKAPQVLVLRVCKIIFDATFTWPIANNVRIAYERSPFMDGELTG